MNFRKTFGFYAKNQFYTEGSPFLISDFKFQISKL